MSLEIPLRALLEKSGSLRIHLWTCAGGFQANVAEPGVNAWTCYTHEDPIVALETALRQRIARTPDREVRLPDPSEYTVDIEELIAAPPVASFEDMFG